MNRWLAAALPAAVALIPTGRIIARRFGVIPVGVAFIACGFISALARNLLDSPIFGLVTMAVVIGALWCMWPVAATRDRAASAAGQIPTLLTLIGLALAHGKPFGAGFDLAARCLPDGPLRPAALAAADRLRYGGRPAEAWDLLAARYPAAPFTALAGAARIADTGDPMRVLAVAARTRVRFPGTGNRVMLLIVCSLPPGLAAIA